MRGWRERAIGRLGHASGGAIRPKTFGLGSKNQPSGFIRPTGNNSTSEFSRFPRGPATECAVRAAVPAAPRRAARGVRWGRAEPTGEEQHIGTAGRSEEMTLVDGEKAVERALGTAADGGGGSRGVRNPASGPAETGLPISRESREPRAEPRGASAFRRTNCPLLPDRPRGSSSKARRRQWRNSRPRDRRDGDEHRWTIADTRLRRHGGLSASRRSFRKASASSYAWNCFPFTPPLGARRRTTHDSADSRRASPGPVGGLGSCEGPRAIPGRPPAQREQGDCPTLWERVTAARMQLSTCKRRPAHAVTPFHRLGLHPRIRKR